jgi:cytochrome P450
MIEPIQQACDKTLSALLPPSQDWTPHNGQTLLWPLVSRIMARAFVGPELWDSQEWHWVVATYFQAGLAASQRIRDRYRPWLRWSAKYFDKDVKAIRAARQKGQQLLRPLIDARVADALDRPRGREPAFNDAVQWLVDAYIAENKPVKADQVMQDEAFLVAASLHGTTFTALSVLFDLIDRPESLAEIRAEISHVYAEHGSWTRQSLGALRILDSFMKESQRLHNFQYSKP